MSANYLRESAGRIKYLPLGYESLSDFLDK